MSEMGNNGEYYAKGRTVHKSPTEKPAEPGVTRFTVGFPVCTLSEWLDDEAAAHIADALNAFERVSTPDPTQEQSMEVRA